MMTNKKKNEQKTNLGKLEVDCLLPSGLCLLLLQLPLLLLAEDKEGDSEVPINPEIKEDIIILKKGS